MLWLWRFIVGYVTIEIYGDECELILNRAASNGINLWDLKYKKGSIYGNISTKNFIKLHTIKRGLKCKIRIIKKHGLIFRIKKHKKRIGFLVGMIIFIAILFLLSNFVWIINIEGNYIIPTKEIINSCQKIGIYEGIKKQKINSKYDAQRLQLIQNGIAWCSFNVEGCVLTINLSEVSISDDKERQTPSNLKASIEGKIKKIDVTSGNAVVKVGDTVSKGDLLVSGVIENLSSTHFVHSSGEIIAETKRVFSSQGDFKQKIKAETNEKITRYTIEFFGFKLPLYLGNVKKTYNYKCTVKNLKLFQKKIPVKIIKENYNITRQESINYTKQTLEKMLYKDIKKQVDDFEFKSYEESDKEIIYTDKGILIKITYICEENIAVQNNILLSTKN